MQRTQGELPAWCGLPDTGDFSALAPAVARDPVWAGLHGRGMDSNGRDAKCGRRCPPYGLAMAISTLRFSDRARRGLTALPSNRTARSDRGRHVLMCD